MRSFTGYSSEPRDPYRLRSLWTSHPRIGDPQPDLHRDVPSKATLLACNLAFHTHHIIKIKQKIIKIQKKTLLLRLCLYLFKASPANDLDPLFTSGFETLIILEGNALRCCSVPPSCKILWFLFVDFPHFVGVFWSISGFVRGIVCCCWLEFCCCGGIWCCGRAAVCVFFEVVGSVGLVAAESGSFWLLRFLKCLKASFL